MAQGTKSFASTRFHLENLPKEPGGAMHTQNLNPELTETGEDLGQIASPPRLTGEFQTTERPCFKNIKECRSLMSDVCG